MEKLNDIRMFVYNHKKITAVIAFGLIVLSMALIFYSKNNYQTETLVYEESLTKEPTEKEKASEEYYYVDIKGEVTTPGVYSLSKGKRVVDAINQAGGVTEKADTSLLNLSMELEDGMVIVIYSTDEIKNYDKAQKMEQQAKLCNDKVVNDACLNNSNSTIVTNLGITEEKADIKTKTETSKEVTSTKININKASVEELMTLSKIGESKAKAIISYRQENGSFKTIEDLKKVSGIGDKIFNEIKAYITI